MAESIFVQSVRAFSALSSGDQNVLRPVFVASLDDDRNLGQLEEVLELIDEGDVTLAPGNVAERRNDRAQAKVRAAVEAEADAEAARAAEAQA